MSSKLALQRLDAGGGLAFEALRHAHLPAIAAMFGDPEVARWYGEDPLDEITGHIDDAVVSPFLVTLEGAPLGYVQAYHANAEAFWAGFGVPRETYGLDMFLGARRGEGLGRRVCRALIGHLFTLPGVVRVQIDPDPENRRAVAAYAAAGFEMQGVFAGYYPGERMAYMTIDRP